VYQPTYLSGHYGYLLCSDQVDAAAAATGADWAAYHRKRLDMHYYSPSVHAAVGVAQQAAAPPQRSPNLCLG
jgi:hypothetical protein